MRILAKLGGKNRKLPPSPDLVPCHATPAPGLRALGISFLCDGALSGQLWEGERRSPLPFPPCQYGTECVGDMAQALKSHIFFAAMEFFGGGNLEKLSPKILQTGHQKRIVPPEITSLSGFVFVFFC